MQAEAAGRAPAPSFWTRPWVIRLTSVVLVLSAWETYGRQINPVFMSYPTAVVRAAYKVVFVESALGQAWMDSMSAFVVGYLLSVVIGVAVGFAMGRSRIIELALDPYVTMLYATPRVALVPLLILWFGIAFELRVAIIFLSSVFPVIINTLGGVKYMDEELVETAHAFSATNQQILRTVVIPGTLPYVFVGIRLALGQGLIGVIVAEMTASVSGLGGMIVTYGNYFLTDKLFVPILATAFTSLAMTALIKWLETALMPYRHLRETN